MPAVQHDQTVPFQAEIAADALGTTTVAGSFEEDEKKHHDVETQSTGKISSAEDQTAGVTKMEALFLVFGGWKIYILYASIGLVCYVYSLSSNTTYIYLSFATSSFADHPIIGTIGTVTSIASSVLQPVVAKVADITSRPWAIVMAVAFYCVGFIVMATSHNVGTVCGGQIIYTIGTTGLSLLTTILVADVSSLQMRGIANSLAACPYILNAFIAGYISDAVSLENWRWGYGMFVIIVPVAIFPAVVVLFWADRRAKQLGALSLASSTYVRERQLRNEVQKSWLQMAIYYWRIIDGFGLVLLATAFTLILLPFTLYTAAENGFRNASMIAMLVCGFVIMGIFAGWEIKFAPHPLCPKRFLNKSFCSSIAIDFLYYLSGYVSDTYLSSWVYVVKDWNTRNYTFFNNTETVGLCLFAFIAGIICRYTHRYKYMQLSGLCIRIVGMGITYYASTGNISDATLVMGRILISFGGSFSVIGTQTATQASVPHQDMATTIGLLTLWTYVGGAIGQAISAAIWNNQLPKQLAKYGGEYWNATEITEIFGSIVVARTTEPRDVIIQAYNKTFYYLTLPALILSFLPLIAGCMTENFYLGTNHNNVEDKEIIIKSQAEIDEHEIATKAAEVERKVLATEQRA